MAAVSVQSILGSAEWPALPAAYGRLASAINDPGGSDAAVVDILRQETGLSAWMLTVANSPLFQSSSPIETVEAAVRLIGSQQMLDLVLMVMIVGLCGRINPEIVSTESFWRHGIACGIVARAIAAQRREANIERFFAAGLLHDIGSLLLYPHIPEHSLMRLLHARDVSVPLYQLEREVLGFDHAELGGALLREWSLPEALEAGVAYHHVLERAANHQLEAAVVHVADIITHALELGSSGEYCVPPLTPEAWRLVGLPVSALAALIEQVDRQLGFAFTLLMGANAMRQRQI